MRRSFVILLGLFAAVRSSAAAQTCMGLGSYGAGPVQVTANGSFSVPSNSIGATVGYGTSSSVYGTVGVTATSYDAIDGSTLALAARAGYQLTIPTARPVQVCPSASFGIGMGPNDDAAGIDQYGRLAAIGVNLGTELAANPRMRVIPTAGISFAHSTQRAENSAGTELFEISDSYWMAQVGVGIVLNQRISVRPTVDIPLDRLESSDPTFGLTLGYNFGK